MILEPYENIIDFNFKTYGFSTKNDKEENKIIIKSITENSSASRLKIPLKSEVISINSINMTDLKTYCEYKVTRNIGDSITIKIKHNDSIQQFSIKKEYLFN